MKRRNPFGFLGLFTFIKIVLIFFLFSGISNRSIAQVDVLSSGGTAMATYPTLADGFIAINGGTHTGTITINITANTTEPVGGAILNASGAGSANYSSIIIKPTGGAARTISGAATAGLPLIELFGADNVTIDGLNTGGNSLTINNTTVSATSGTSTIKFSNDALNNTLIRLTIYGSSTMSTTTNGGTIFFSTALSTATIGNDNNLISTCKIGGVGANLPTKAIYSQGTTTNISNYNSNNTITNNEIFDYFNPTLQSNGVYIAGGTTDWIISNNKFYQTATRTQTTAAIHAAIQLANANCNNFSITGNIIGFANETGSGVYTFVGIGAASRFVGIYLSSHGTIAPTNITNNTIQAISISGAISGTSTVASFLGIYIGTGLANADNNTIGSLNGTNPITLSSTSASVGEAIGIYNFSSSAGITSINNNSIGSIIYTNTSTGGSGVQGIRTFTTTTNTMTINNNTIGGVGGELKSVNTSATGASGNQIIGIQIQSGVHMVTNNTVTNLTTNSPSAGTTTLASVIGLYSNSTAAGSLISLNKFHTFSNTNTTAAVWVSGMHIGSTTTPTEISKNNIHSLNTASTSSTATINGIGVTGGTSNYINNMIRLGIDAAGAPILNGIALNGVNETGGTNNYFNNSIFIGGLGVSSGTANTFAFSSTVVTSTRFYLNNIFYNARSNSGSTGKHYAVRVGGTAPNPAGLTINYNDYLVNGTGGVLGLFNAIDQLNLPAWRTAVGQDCNSISSDPKFINPTGTNVTGDLHIQVAVPTPIEQAGLDLGTTVTQDFDNQMRSSFTPTDLGADAGNFIALDISPPNISFTPLTSSCGTGNIILTGVNITDATGVPTTGVNKPRIYFRKNAGAWFSNAGILLSGSGTNGTWEFTILAATMGGLVFGDIVDYYLIAQDLATPINIASNPCGAIAVDVNTVTSPPTTLYSLTVKDFLSGVYTVGVGGNYITLTAAVADYNNKCASGPITFLLIDNTYPSETFPITINAIPGQSAVNTLTIKPDVGKNPLISGSSASGLIVLNGADFVTINGSNGSTSNTICPPSSASRNLTFTNTNTSTASAVIWLQWLFVGSTPNSAANNQIINCNISGSAPTQTLVGIGSGSTTISASTLGFLNNNNSFINNNISKTQFGIISIGQSAATKNSGNIINQNLINTASPNNVQTGGIFVGFEDNILISGNNVSEMALAGSPDVFGISAGFTNSGFSATSPGTNECTNVTISNNLIGTISNTGTFSAVGIALGATNSGTSTILNNMVSGVNANATAGDIGIGLVIGGGTGTIKVYNNTIAMQGAITGTSAASQTSACLGFTSGTIPSSLELKNNIFSNTQIGNTGATLRFTSIALGYSSTVGNYAGLISNNNDLYSAGAGPGTYTLGITGGVVAGISRLTIADWRAETGKDNLSVNVLPSYVSPTDLHLTASGNACLNQSAMPLASVPLDIDCQTRSLSNPDIGADEFTGTDLTVAVTETSGIPNDKKVCLGASATVTVAGGISHKWNTGETTPAITKMPASTTIYFDTVTVATGCLVIMTDTIFVLPLPMAAITPAMVTICNGQSTTLTASGGGTYLWNTGATTAAITVNPASTTSYTVTVTSANLCTATATATVTVNPVPTAVITPSAPTICSGATQTLTASGGVTYLWSTGATTPAIMVTPPSTTSYTVTVTAANGCTATKTATVTVITGVTITETHTEPTSCFSFDGAINITATGVTPLTYSWATPDGFGLNPSSEDQSAITVGTYNVTVTSSNGCTGTKTITLVGPGNCGLCPTIGGLTKSVSTVCKTTNFTLTATGLTNMGTLYGILFKYSPVVLPDPYVGGTTLGIVPNAGLSGGGTSAVLITNIPTNANYFLYAIVTPTPLSPACRPSANNTINVLKCAPDITDPCSCKNNATTLINGQFNEVITVNAPSGQIWTVSSNTGLYLPSSPAPPAAPVIIPNGFILTEVPLGNGVSNYILNGIHVDALGYVVMVANNSGIIASQTNRCYYPNPSIIGLASVYCANDPSVTLVGNAQLGDGSGPAMGVGTFTINGIPATTFNPAALGAGTHNVVFSFDAADGVPNGSHPGCVQAISQTVVVNPVPTLDPVMDRILCVGQTSAQIIFTGTPTGVMFDWSRTNEAIGAIPNSGTNSIPSFVATNAGTTPLTATFSVVARYTNAGKTCFGTPFQFTITVNPAPVVNPVPDVQYCHGDNTTAITFTSNVPGVTFNWVRTPEPIGLAATSGMNTVPAFTTTNPSAVRITSTFTVTPVYFNPRGGPSCSGTPITFRISVLPQPVARCKNATIYVDKTGMVMLTVPDVDNGSTGARTLTLSKSLFNCANIGPNTVTLTAADSCGKTSSCMATVTVLDTIRPIINCPKDYTVNLDPGECTRIINYNIPEATDNCNQTVVTTTATITTAFNSNNQFAGNMFNITNTSTGPITLTSFASNIIGTVGGTCTASVYYTPMTYVGKETNAAAWTLMATGNGICAGLNLPTVFNTIGGLVIQPGETYGLFFYLDSYGTYTLRYTNGNITFSNADLLLTLGVGKGNPVFTGATFAGRYWNGTINYTKQTIVGAPPVVTQIDKSGLKTGDAFPRGTTCQTFLATDFSGNTASCSFCITVKEFQNPVTFITCHDEIQISLNESCYATVGADEVLSGGPYGCYDDYGIVLQDWITGQIIDRFPNIPGSQVGSQDIGREFKVTVIDSVTGNSCWGHVVVEDKLAPVLICARDTCVECGSSELTPAFMGTPVVRENCGSYSLTYKDVVTIGGCTSKYEQLIERTWTAVDGQGNKAICKQVITVSLATIASINVPHDFDDLDLPALSCDEKINPNKDLTPHYLPFPYCVDGYLLDSAHWFATGGFLPSPNGDLAGERLPRVLGWNCIDTGLYIGHPSPWPIYYPAHPNFRPNNPICWGPDEIIMWQGTGVPTGSECSNLGMTFKDVKIDVAKPNCDAGPIGCFKILRQWTVLDWCTGTIGGHNQIIKVIDREGPQILYPDSVTINMEVWRCYGYWEVPKPWLIDNCSNELHYSLQTNAGVVTGNERDGFILTNIERGLGEVFIYAEDCCGNISKKRIAINVPDNTPPIAVCDQKTIVSITGNQSPGENYAKIFAEDFDQGSFDNCSPHVFFKAIRMEHLRGTNNGSNANQSDNGTNCSGINGDDNSILDGNQIYFDDHVKFCCTDVGKTIMVVFRVFDIEPGSGPITPSRMNSGGNLFNHYSDCMVEVEVQDKSVPTVVPPPNIVVSCWFWFDVDKISDPNDATFGKVVNDLSARKKVVTNDLVCHNYCVRNDITGYPGFVPGAPPSNPPAWNRACEYYRVLFDTAHEDRKYELVWGFDGTVLGSCGTNFTISVNDNRECGQGQITRTVVARGPNGISVTATQTIWVVDCDPFYINREDPCDPDDDITWPGNCTGQATTIDGCGADISPDNPLLGRPIIENNADDLCALISIEHFDEIFTIEPDACFKVLRTWVVIDWCQYDPGIDPQRGRWEYLQIIKVHDTDKPVVSITIGKCEPAEKNNLNGICYAHIELTADATDNCSPLDWLFYDYKIDLYNDGKGDHSGFDLVVGPLTRKDYAGGKSPLRHHNPFADNPNNPFNASGTYPIGIHKICWYVEDGCGNIGANCQLFEIKDCKAPTPYCEVGIITVIMPSSKCITIWAKDLDRGSFDNCTPSNKLLFYFNGDRSMTSKTICCGDLEAVDADDELFVPVDLWVEDEEGNTDFCKTLIVIQDTQDSCANVGSFGKIVGALKTEGDQTTEHVDTRLYQSGSMMKQMTTAGAGQYFFGNLAFGQSMEYKIEPVRNDDPLNGVSTADIVKIQRHILGIESLNSPYKLIAADANKSGNITAADISEIRKLILGVTDRFAKNDSWTFVPNSYAFADPFNPWSAPRDVLVKVDEAKTYKEDFVSVKIGDVTNNARAHSYHGSTGRNNGQLHFEIDNKKTVPGELYRLEMKSSDFNNISGFQFTLKFDQKVLHFEKIEAAALNINESNFGLYAVDNGILTSSWDAKKGQSAHPDEVLFTLIFRAESQADITGLFSINNSVTNSEAYDDQLLPKDILLGIRTANEVVDNGDFELFQNNPNPFSKQTTIQFNLPQAAAVKLSIYDVTGKVIRIYELNGLKGTNTVKIDRAELNRNGLLYYQLDAANHTATRQMILIEN